MTSPSWHPDQYLRYGDERARPFFDLVARLPESGVATAVDLGCGTGHLTRTLLDRWPAAHVTGVDSSPDMLAKARPLSVPDRLDFVEGDIATWRPDRAPDCIVSNAALQWVPDHEALIPRLAGMVAPGGVFAFQIPNNNDEAAYHLLDRMRTSEPWASLAPTAAGERSFTRPAAFYVDLLAGHDFAVDCWETIYYHQLAAPGDIVEWVKGSALRPVLDALPEADSTRFLDAYTAEVEQVYRPGPAGVLFPFRRLFVIAHHR